MALEVIFSMLQSLGADLRHQLMTIMWSLWRHNNIKLWQNEVEVLIQVGVDRARKMMDDWLEANDVPSSSWQQDNSSHSSQLQQ